MKHTAEIDLIRKIPCILNVNEDAKELWRIVLFDSWLPSTLSEWKKNVDSLSYHKIKPTVFLNYPDNERYELTNIYCFPSINLPDFPKIETLHHFFADYFEIYYQTESKILKQSEITNKIFKKVSQDLPDIVVFLILDGFSFYDSLFWQFPENYIVQLEPCLVDGLTITAFGMRRLIGKPPLAHFLFEVGYQTRFGFSYWERNRNDLTDDIFTEFPITQLYRVTTIEDVLQILGKVNFKEKTFIQIVRTGLDNVCHTHREKPDLESMTRYIKESIISIIDLINQSKKRMRFYITADHGILWFNDQKITPLNDSNHHPRYIKGLIEDDPNIISMNESGEFYSSLANSTTIARPRKVTEWGFHGGISAEESLVPFIEISFDF